MKTIVFASQTVKHYFPFLKEQCFTKLLYSQKTVFGIFLLSLSTFLAQGQISLTFPVPRAVIQRNNANQASLNIAGQLVISKHLWIELRLD